MVYEPFKQYDSLLAVNLVSAKEHPQYGAIYFGMCACGVKLEGIENLSYKYCERGKGQIQKGKGTIKMKQRIKE